MCLLHLSKSWKKWPERGGRNSGGSGRWSGGSTARGSRHRGVPRAPAASAVRRASGGRLGRNAVGTRGWNPVSRMSPCIVPATHTLTAAYLMITLPGFGTFILYIFCNKWAGIAQSVERHATGCKVRDRVLVEARFSVPVQTGPAAHTASCTMCPLSRPGIKWPERGVNYPPSLAPRLKKEYNCTSTSLLCLHGRL